MMDDFSIMLLISARPQARLIARGARSAVSRRELARNR
jgi:hypothetical protein